MFIILLFMVCGIVIGRLLRARVSGGISFIITFLIWLLLFILGAEVGGNADLIKGISNLGFEALIITLGAIAGSVIFAFVLWRFVIAHNNGGNK